MASSPEVPPGVNRSEGRNSSFPMTLYRGVARHDDVTGRNFTEEERKKRKEMFLQAYALKGTIKAGCDAATINRTTYYFWLERDGKFADSLALAKEDYEDSIREAIHTRAIDGIVKERRVYYKGDLVDVQYETEYSDTLLAQMAKAKLPEYQKDSEEEANKKIPLSAIQDIARALGETLASPEAEVVEPFPDVSKSANKKRAKDAPIDVYDYRIVPDSDSDLGSEF